jgi:hypothetical protein
MELNKEKERKSEQAVLPNPCLEEEEEEEEEEELNLTYVNICLMHFLFRMV